MSIAGRRQTGASILEFLITVPVYFALAYTAIEFGTIFVRLDTLTKSVQDATRYLSDAKSSAESTNTAAQQAIAVNLIKYGSVGAGTQLLPGTYSAPSITNPDADHVQVSVVYNHIPLGGQALNNLLKMPLLGGSGIDLTLQLPASSTMRYAR